MAKTVLRPIQKTIAACRLARVPVIFTQRVDDPLQPTQLSEWWPGGEILEGSSAGALLPELDRNEKTDFLVKKSTYSAFHKTDLSHVLAEKGVKELIITGVMTNLCCETTAREAFVRGFTIFFSNDATATCNQELQEASLKNLAYGFAYLVDVKQIQEAFESSGSVT